MEKPISHLFPDEIIINITSRLPSSSICRYRCVSKSWRTLLSHPQFIQRHIHHIRNSKLLQQSISFINPKTASLCYVSFPFNNIHVFGPSTAPPTKKSYSWNKILGSCHGLVLLESIGNVMYLVNPITKEMKPVTHKRLFDQVGYGFGYDSVNDDYKIVILFVYYDSRDMTHAHVYSLKNDTWIIADSSSRSTYDVYSTESVLVDGCVHWIKFNNNSASFVISAFDLTQEKFNEITPASALSKSSHNYYLEELQGCLCMVWKNYQNKQTYLYVWIMKEYGNEESWTKLNTIVLYGFYFTSIPFCMLSQEALALLVAKDEDQADLSFVTDNSKNATLSDVDALITSYLSCPPYYLISKRTFVESFVSPHSK